MKRDFPCGPVVKNLFPTEEGMVSPWSGNPHATRQENPHTTTREKPTHQRKRFLHAKTKIP